MVENDTSLQLIKDNVMLTQNGNVIVTYRHVHVEVLAMRFGLYLIFLHVQHIYMLQDLFYRTIAIEVIRSLTQS